MSELFTAPTRRFHLTRRGKILQSTTERYLRDDLGYGTVLLPTKTNTTIAGDATELVPRTIVNIDMLYNLVDGGSIVIVDTNVLLHHMDVLEYVRPDDGIRNSIAAAVVIPQTALEECRNRSLVMYRRVTDLIRSSSMGKQKRAFVVFADLHHVDTQFIDEAKMAGEDTRVNDENDARLRKVAEHYGRAVHNHHLESNHEGDKMEVIFLTDDAASRKLAKDEQGDRTLYYTPRSMREHVTIIQKEDPTLNLLDMVAQFNAQTNASQSIEYYPPHIPSSQLSVGLKTNKYYQGTFRSDRDRYNSGYVTVRGGNEERVAVVIQGDQNVNRAVDGDIVAIELFGVEKWLASSDGKEETTTKEKTGIAADTAEPSVKDMDNVDEELVDETGALRRPTGRIVGIIRRNFHKNYCGSIWTVDAAADDNDKHPNDIIVAKNETEHADGITSTVVFFSIDPRVPPVLIRTTQRERLLGMRILVSMDSWPSDSEFPLGHYVKTLGVAGTKDTETEVLLQEFRIPCEPFPAKVRVLMVFLCREIIQMTN
jgi:exosome complex exonuclease DIS3/RRP44